MSLLNNYKCNYDDVNNKLSSFLKEKAIPNIIFHGNCATKKEEIVINFIQKIYDSIEDIKAYVMYVNCAHNKGIKFVREELKYFAKTNVQHHQFKTVVFFNADKLTIDAQSALRRCIEIFSHSTRFFMVVDNISKLLNPILSRFCSIHIVNEQNHFCSYHDNNSYKQISSALRKITTCNIFELAESLYKKGISALHILEYIKNSKSKSLDEERVQFILFYLNKIKKEIRQEKLLIVVLLSLLQVDNNDSNKWLIDYFM